MLRPHFMERGLAITLKTLEGVKVMKGSFLHFRVNGMAWMVALNVLKVMRANIKKINKIPHFQVMQEIMANIHFKRLRAKTRISFR